MHALTDALQKKGWTHGGNLGLEVQWAGSDAHRIQEIASIVVSLTPAAVVSAGSVATAAMKRATSTIPVVFVMVNEPVTQGFVASLARPGSNITLEHMRARPVEIVRAAVHSTSDIDPVIDTLATVPGSGLAVLPDGGFTLANRGAIQSALVRHHMPSIAPFRQFVSEGALMSYGPDDVDIFRRAADYVDRILKGTKPADLPVQQPLKFELVINLNTAKAIGLTVPTSLLARADEVMNE
jgi:ABC-type uncharacterized transport system substrate-binding protein